MAILEKLCYRFARDHLIDLKTHDGGLYGEGNGLEVGLIPVGVATLFGVEKKSESSVIIVYNLLNMDDKTAELEIESTCLRDYLTLLSHSKSAFPQLARERFENYLDQTEPARFKEKFDEINALDVFWVLNAFYPPIRK